MAWTKRGVSVSHLSCVEKPLQLPTTVSMPPVNVGTKIGHANLSFSPEPPAPTWTEGPMRKTTESTARAFVHVRFWSGDAPKGPPPRNATKELYCGKIGRMASMASLESISPAQ